MTNKDITDQCRRECDELSDMMPAIIALVEGDGKRFMALSLLSFYMSLVLDALSRCPQAVSDDFIIRMQNDLPAAAKMYRSLKKKGEIA